MKSHGSALGTKPMCLNRDDMDQASCTDQVHLVVDRYHDTPMTSQGKLVTDLVRDRLEGIFPNLVGPSHYHIQAVLRNIPLCIVTCPNPRMLHWKRF